MKKKMRLLAVLLTLVMVTTCAPVYAAPESPGTYAAFSFSGWWGNFWDKVTGHDKNSNKETTEETEEETPETVVSEETTEETEDMEMTVVEDETTVENGEMLRAATYALTVAETGAEDEEEDSAAEESTSTTLKYFPITMYDYDTSTINNATMAKEQAGAAIYEGIYFSDGSPEYQATTNAGDKSAFVAGEYYIQNIRASENNAGSWLVGSTNGITSTENQSEATLWTLEVEDGSYYLKCDGGYMVIRYGKSGVGLSAAKTSIDLNVYSGNAEGVQISQGSYYLCQWGSGYATSYGGYNVANNPGNGMRFYRVDGDTQVLTTIVEGETVITSGYQKWNRWDKASGSNANGQKTYTGLVESTLDTNKDIVFTKPEGGIFNSDSSVKSIYTNVEMPFVYENGYYTFDASQNGVYFHEDETQGSNGTAANNTRLYFNKGTTQSNGGTYGDGSTTVWAPYNDSTSFSESEMNYHFGMRATIPFSMTPNGRVVATDDTSDAIKFSFSGDDDVWVFVDGQLVVDLGGIHNRLDVEIDFANNTVTYLESNALDATTGSYNDEDFALTQTLFGGLISQDRTTFAASDSHELTIFYLERGMGSSNCKIEFNLPVNDSLTVTKDATQSWSKDSNEVTPLTDAEQAIVDNIDFDFTLYRGTDAVGEDAVVANTNYYLLNSNGQIIDTPQTDAHGVFSLKNGQSARFITTEMDDEDGVTYYVREKAVNGFTDPDYNYGGEAANGFRDAVSGEEYTSGSDIPELECHDGSTASDKITVFGGEESEDSLVFICSNFLDAELPNPSARPVEDKIVIDYGLPVEIDVLANDVYRGNKIELVSVTGAGVEVNEDTGDVTNAGSDPVYGTAEINKDEKITYTLSQQLSGVEVLNYVVKVTGTATQEVTGSGAVAYEYAVGTVYVIPATSMYYEEDFSNMVTFSAGTWSVVGTAETENQEPGVVGTIGDSPYGSDAAYINDSKDSNGSSQYVSTASAAAQFQYTFTGWGTSFFARTTNNTGYMRVVITDANGENVYTSLRNTVYKADSDTLYNIPVFTYNTDDYGTYTVTVTIAKGSTIYGSDFWLDGIRVLSPLNAADANVAIAESAYATDAEANMAVVTLREKLLTDVTTDSNGKLVWNVTDQTNGNFVLFTDSNGTILSAEEYQSDGPKEEVYLNDGQKVSFSLKKWDANANKIYLGVKAPKGSGTVIINGHSLTLSNAADCYYDITNYATITTAADGTKTATFEIQAGSGSLVSVTNIKVTGNFEFAIIDGNFDTETEAEEDGNDFDAAEGSSDENEENNDIVVDDSEDNTEDDITVDDSESGEEDDIVVDGE